MRLSLALVGVSLLCLLGPGVAQEVTIKPDPEEPKFRGTWEVISVEEDGKVEKKWAKFRVIFGKRGENEWNEGEVITPDGDKGRAVWWLDSSKKPKAIYFGFALLIRPGIYKMEGEELRMCFAGRGEQAPPKQFSGSVESKAALWKLKKVK